MDVLTNAYPMPLQSLTEQQDDMYIYTSTLHYLERRIMKSDVQRDLDPDP